MAGHQDWLLREAEAWRREGLIDEPTLKALREKYSVRAEEPSEIQRILYVVGGVVLFLGIFFAFTQFWDDLNASSKLSLLLGMAALGYTAATVLEVLRRWGAIAAIGWAVGGALAFFGLSYARAAGAPSPLLAAIVVLAFLMALATLVLGYARSPTAAAVGAGLLYVAFPLSIHLTRPDEAGWDRFVSAAFTMGIVLTGANMGLWWWATRASAMAWIGPAAVRLAAGAFPIGLVPSYLIFMFGVVAPVEQLPTILGLLAIGAVLLAAGIFLRLPEAVLMGGLIVIVGAVWLGSDQGDLIGTSIALVVSAIALIALAQSGLLRRWLTVPSASTR